MGSRARQALRCALLLFASLLFQAPSGAATNPPDSAPAAAVRAILSVPDDELDYGRAKIALDRLIDPSIDRDAILAEIDRLVRRASEIAGPDAAQSARLSAVRRVIYESGDWNSGRPFTYDHDDPMGRNVRSKLISTSLDTRLGNCVSMPILFLIVSERLGLDVSLSTAPLHMFLRHTDEQGREMNLEATSGGMPARTEWYRQHLPMTDLALESGLYMRSLSRREAVAHMASVVVDFLLSEGCFQDAADVAEVILQHNPRDGYTLAKLGTAYGELLRVEFIQPFQLPSAIPRWLRQRYVDLAQRNQLPFEAAEALGWHPSE